MEPKSVLIAEDERTLAEALETKLKSIGHQVIVVQDGQEALDSIAKNKFDLMLLDLMMPKIDGFQVLQKMKDSNIKIPTIVLSNLGQEEEIAKAKTFDVKEYFVKSDTPIAEIIEHVKKVLT